MRPAMEQPTFKQLQPILFFSISTTNAPGEAAMDATDRPADPAPMRHGSGCKTRLPFGSASFTINPRLLRDGAIA